VRPDSPYTSPSQAVFLAASAPQADTSGRLKRTTEVHIAEAIEHTLAVALELVYAMLNSVQPRERVPAVAVRCVGGARRR
jgi:hypothetical protein